MKQRNRLTVAVIGASGTPGDKVLARLARNYKVIRLCNSQNMEQNSKNISTQQCDLFNVDSIISGLQGADLAVFLYPVEFPAVRLSQALLPDMAVLAADSFARAVRETRIGKIIYMKPNGWIPSGNPAEVEKALGTSGVPVKTIPLPSSLIEIPTIFPASTGAVRSIQRVRLPRGKGAKWAAFYYTKWLNRIGSPLIKTEWHGNFCRVRTVLLSRPLLTLHYSEENSFPGRSIYRIAGGLLAANLAGRLEFCQLPSSNHCLIAIHEYQPSLPWFVYKYSQAIIHLLVMKLFKRHLERIT
ncbi:hypothetical protein ERJ70_05955 [Sediminibacillus dalangtanensis]|uniref:NmrA-like domain-containing protein n=1 Tax=Sediminibacillus dalangtanensis TaxID=2729421 RepID=A0ABX7VPP1_9BACI|nr:hypothetical protein [Sediminibacillus dalangtanensis]QTM98882.1 hypothetical protein ERJ70_05955 [Sediminibacillus dalangtanensis]